MNDLTSPVTQFTCPELKQGKSHSQKHPGRPRKENDGSKNSLRRERRRLLQTNPEMKLPRGRPRLENVEMSKNPKRLNKDRVQRLEKKVSSIINNAAAGVSRIASESSSEWQKVFKQSPVSTLAHCMRELSQTKSGKRTMPDFTQSEKQRKMMEEVGAGAIELANEAGRATRGGIIQKTSKYVTDVDAYAGMVSSSKKYILTMRAQNKLPPLLRINKTSYKLTGKGLSDSRTKLAELAELFFTRNTAIRSGAKGSNQTRTLFMNLKDLEELWYSEFPKYCREAARTWFAWYSNLQGKEKCTRFESSVLKSMQNDNFTPADDEKEFMRRQIAMKERYKERLRNERKRWQGLSICNSKEDPGKLKQKTQERMEKEISALELLDKSALSEADKVELTAESKFNEDAELYVPSKYLFWKLVKERQLKWTVNVHPTECPIHDQGPRQETQLQITLEKFDDAALELEKTRTEIKGLLAISDNEREPKLMALRIEESKRSDIYSELRGDLRQLRDQVATYKRHLEQYDKCRSTMKKIENNLKQGEAVLYRDFVNQYMSGGGKLYNLVFVLLWHENEGRQQYERIMKFNHMCSDPETGSCDAYFMADVWEYFLGVSKFLKRKNITKLYVSGDHGPHFSAVQTFFKECTLYLKYQILLHDFFLCSYHAFNRCDSAGREPKKLNEVAIRKRTANDEARSLANMLNESEYHNSVAVPVDKINRSQDVFNEELKPKLGFLRGKCEVKYHWEENGVVKTEHGVVFYRDVPTVPWEKGEDYDIIDVRKNETGGILCIKCSKEMQRPIRHNNSSDCKSSSYMTDIEKDKALCIADGAPLPSRLVGVQLTRANKKNIRKPQGAFPCRVSGCVGYHWYTERYHSNTHMQKVHKLEANDDRLYPKPTKKECKKKKIPQQRKKQEGSQKEKKPSAKSKETKKRRFEFAGPGSDSGSESSFEPDGADSEESEESDTGPAEKKNRQSTRTRERKNYKEKSEDEDQEEEEENQEKEEEEEEEEEEEKEEGATEAKSQDKKKAKEQVEEEAEEDSEMDVEEAEIAGEEVISDIAAYYRGRHISYLYHLDDRVYIYICRIVSSEKDDDGVLWHCTSDLNCSQGQDTKHSLRFLWRESKQVNKTPTDPAWLDTRVPTEPIEESTSKSLILSISDCNGGMSQKSRLKNHFKLSTEEHLDKNDHFMIKMFLEQSAPGWKQNPKKKRRRS